jgi:uncharacterized membrane protein YeaQ/YmgE (transglycosylase-associated protein family)
MGLLAALVIGLAVGVIATLFVDGGRDRDLRGTLKTTALLGVGGALVAFLLGQAAGWYGASSGGPGINASVLGALVVLATYRSVRHPA